MRAIAIALGLWLCSLPMQAWSVIDCSRAITNIDRLLCSNSRAAAAEERMAHAFRAAVRRGVAPAHLRATQLKWREEVRDRCIEVDCLIEAYAARIAELDSLGTQ